MVSDFLSYEGMAMIEFIKSALLWYFCPLHLRSAHSLFELDELC
jgi:hypothetical protein